MDSNSKKHWPSMFIKPKSSTSSGNQLPETSDSSVTRVPRSGLGESSHNYVLERERSQPKPRPRWHPKQEQLRILEAIFQSGMVSPDGEEIKRIRAQLQVFGPVGDVNVHYWFQNRKSRSKRRPRLPRLPPAQRSKSRTDSGTLSSTSSTSTSASVHSKYITEISNSPSNSMHSIIGDQYCSSSAAPVSSFAGNHYDLQAVYEEMIKTSTFAPSETNADLSNNAPNSMHSNIGDQYSSSSAVPVSSFAGNHYDLDAVYEEMMRTSTFAPSETIADLSNNAPNSMYSNIGDQYCSSSAVPVSSFAGNHYDVHAVYKEMNKPSTFAPSETIAGLSNIPPDFMHGIIADQYCSSSAVPVSSSAGHHYDVQTVCEEMNNYNELSNMQVLGAAAAGGQRMLNEGTGGVQQGSIINSNPLITVFINDVPQVIPSGPINLRDFFGDDALLFDSTGESVLANEFGFTCLQHGATYFLI